MARAAAARLVSLILRRKKLKNRARAAQKKLAATRGKGARCEKKESYCGDARDDQPAKA